MMPKVTAQAVTRLAVLVLGLLNAVLEMLGHQGAADLQ
jgi:hypothetical protein